MKKEMKELLQNTYRGDELIGYIELLERENKALDEEGVMKCELNEKLSKALDKICNRQARYGFCHGVTKSSIKCRDKKECAKCWKEWCIKDE